MLYQPRPPYQRIPWGSHPGTELTLRLAKVPYTSTLNGVNINQHSQCRLCLREADLCNSHVVPEFFFAQLYDETHRYYAVTNTKGEQIRLLQKGMREKLLCLNCENQFSGYEHHARSVLYGGTEVACEELGQGFRVHGIEYGLFKLFLMSLLWRLAITSLRFWRVLDLGEHHQERLRAMLLSGNPGEPWQYGCTVIGLLHEGKPFKDLISSPAWGKVQGHRVYALAVGGFLFSFFVSSHKPDFVEEAFLQKSGSRLVMRQEFTNIPFLVEMGTEVAIATRGRQFPGQKG